MLINSRPPDRRRMIHELSDLLNTPAEYLRPPTYGYRIGSLPTGHCNHPSIPA